MTEEETIKQDKLVELGTKIFIYQAIYDAMDEETQDRLIPMQQAGFKKYVKFAEAIDTEIAGQITEIEAAARIYIETFLEDLLKLVGEMYPDENESE